MKSMARSAAQAFCFPIMNLPLHLEVPKALALTVAQADRRPACGAGGSPGRREGRKKNSRGAAEPQRREEIMSDEGQVSGVVAGSHHEYSLPFRSAEGTGPNSSPVRPTARIAGRTGALGLWRRKMRAGRPRSRGDAGVWKLDDADGRCGLRLRVWLRCWERRC